MPSVRPRLSNPDNPVSTPNIQAMQAAASSLSLAVERFITSVSTEPNLPTAS